MSAANPSSGRGTHRRRGARPDRGLLAGEARLRCRKVRVGSDAVEQLSLVGVRWLARRLIQSLVSHSCEFAPKPLGCLHLAEGVVARLDEQVYPRCELVAVFVNYPLVSFHAGGWWVTRHWSSPGRRRAVTTPVGARTLDENSLRRGSSRSLLRADV